MKYLIFFTFVILFFSSCEKSNSVVTNSKIKVAYLSDSLVNGVQYKCDNKITGITGDFKNEKGSFLYQENCNVTFYIGKITLGSIHGKNIQRKSKIIYPIDLKNKEIDLKQINYNKAKEFSNLFVFLQSLNINENLNNGITIPKSVINNLSKTSVNKEILLNQNITYEKLSEIINIANENASIVSVGDALNHFENTLKKDLNKNVDFTGPATPYLIEDLNISVVNVNQRIFKIYGEKNSTILIAKSFNDNDTNLTYTSTNLKIYNNPWQDIMLNFNNNNNSRYYYFIKLEDENHNVSESLLLNIFKDTQKPLISSDIIFNHYNSSYEYTINEDSLFIGEIKYEDASKVNLSITNNQDIGLNVKLVGNKLYFENESSLIDFDSTSQHTFNIKVNLIDEAFNNNDINITLKILNILDNPPKLTKNIYETNITEGINNGEVIYNLSNTINKNLFLEPDNDPLLSPIVYKLINHTDKFDINSSSGEISIKDNTYDFFDFESDIRVLDLNFSVENNNTIGSDGNISYAILAINLENTIDTKPFINKPQKLNVNERNIINPIYNAKEDINISLSDRNLDMNFTIISNSPQFTISTDGKLSVKTVLDYESDVEHNITIRAENTFDYFDFILELNVINEIDNSPSITIKDINTSLLQSTNSNFIVGHIETNGTIIDTNTITLYKITSPNPLFNIDLNGTIRTSQSLITHYNETLNKNSLTVHNIKVIAQNRYFDGSLHDSNIISIDFNISNVINNVPVLNNSDLNISLNENLALNSIIYEANTSGNIFDENEVYKYYLQENDFLI